MGVLAAVQTWGTDEERQRHEKGVVLWDLTGQHASVRVYALLWRVHSVGGHWIKGIWKPWPEAGLRVSLVGVWLFVAG
jgi:hypothetical protein